MPKKTETQQTETRIHRGASTARADTPATRAHRTPQRAPNASRASRRDADVATGRALARIEQALRDAVEAAFHLAHEKSSTATERACIRRVRRAFLSPTRTVPEFEDLAITADALLRAFESQIGPIDPCVGTFLVHEIASALSAPRAARSVRLRRVSTPRRAPHLAPHPSFNGERFYGLA